MVNGLAFSSTNFCLCLRLTGHGEGERKRHDLALKRLQRARYEWNKNWKQQILSTKDYVKKMRQGHTSRMLMKQCLNFIKYLQKK